MSKRKETAPKVKGFLQYLKSIYDIEANAETALPKKWEFLILKYHPSKPVFFVCFFFFCSPRCFLIPCTLSVFGFGYICSAITPF